MSNTDLNTLEVVVNDDRFKQRIAQLAKAKVDADAAVEKAEKAKAEADEFVRAAQQTRQEHESRLAGAKDEHDRAAVEAGERIRVGNEQAAELLRLRSEVEKREKDVAQREATVEIRTKSLDAHDKRLHEREVSMVRREAAHKERVDKLTAAING
jgi:hypothetical protein